MKKQANTNETFKNWEWFQKVWYTNNWNTRKRRESSIEEIFEGILCEKISELMIVTKLQITDPMWGISFKWHKTKGKEKPLTISRGERKLTLWRNKGKKHRRLFNTLGKRVKWNT
jgi:hypothetical protein